QSTLAWGRSRPIPANRRCRPCPGGAIAWPCTVVLARRGSWAAIAYRGVGAGGARYLRAHNKEHRPRLVCARQDNTERRQRRRTYRDPSTTCPASAVQPTGTGLRGLDRV